MEHKGYHIKRLPHKKGFEVYKNGFKTKKIGILFWKKKIVVPAKIYIYDSPYGKWRGHTDDQISYQLPDRFDSMHDATKAINYIIEGEPDRG